MLSDLFWWQWIALAGAGVLAGFINTLAGGGSMLTLPALMMLGMPPDIANGTNRVGILAQSLAGMRGFDKEQQLQRSAMLPIIVPTLLGSLVGASTASYLPPEPLKILLLGSMLLMALVMLVKPAVIDVAPGTTALSPAQNPKAWMGLFLAGCYGGFVQAGVGFILLAALAGGLRYDLVRANALKMACTAALSVIALAVFILRDQVWWIPGLVLAVSSALGAQMSVKVAVNVSPVVLRWFLFVMVCLVCLGALYS